MLLDPLHSWVVACDNEGSRPSSHVTSTCPSHFPFHFDAALSSVASPRQSPVALAPPLDFFISHSLRCG